MRRPSLTVWEIRMAELKVLAGAGGVLLRAQWPLHLLYLLLQGVEGAEDLLHAISIVHIALPSPIVQELAGVDVPPSPGRLDWQGLDDLTWRALVCRREQPWVGGDKDGPVTLNQKPGSLGFCPGWRTAASSLFSHLLSISSTFCDHPPTRCPFPLPLPKAPPPLQNAVAQGLSFVCCSVIQQHTCIILL